MSNTANEPTTVTVTPGQLPRYMMRTWKTKRIPIVHGGPGIGKSRIHFQIGDALGLPVISMRAATREPTAIAGIPIPDLKEGTVRWLPDEMWPKRSCLWFLDELNRAPMLTQNACFQLFDEGRIGGSVLPEGCLLSVAVNREQDGGGVVRMPQALTNRFVHFYLEPNADDWCEWAYDNDIDPMVIAFIQWRPALLYQFSKTDDAWPSPRQWEYLSDIIKDDPDYETLKVFVYGTVGHTVVAEFMAFAQQYKALTTVDVDKILNDPKHAPVPHEPSALYAVSSALGERANAKTLANIMTYMERVGKEYAVFCMKLATKRHPDLVTTKAFVDFAVRYKSVTF